MQDYSAGQGLSDEEAGNSMFFALLGNSDPMTYEEAAKSKRWRSVMDQEMQAIEEWHMGAHGITIRMGEYKSKVDF